MTKSVEKIKTLPTSIPKNIPGGKLENKGLNSMPKYQTPPPPPIKKK